MWINHLEIENFKGIDSIEFPVRKLNIIVGRNNTCKTTILEAISLITHLFPNQKKKIKNISKYLSFPIPYTFYQKQDKAKIKLELIKEENSFPLKFELHLKKSFSNEDIQKKIEYLEFKEKLVQDRLEKEINLIRMKFRRALNIDKKDEDNLMNLNAFESLIENKKIKLENTINNVLEHAILLQFFSKSKIISEAIFIDPNNTDYDDLIHYLKYENLYSYFINHQESQEYSYDFRSTFIVKQDLGELFHNIVENNQLNELIDYLSKKIPFFRQLTESNGILYVNIINNENKSFTLPVHLMGTGFQELLRLYFSLYQSVPILLIEEIEHAFHPGYLDLISEKIIENIDRHQFFITTHNIEFIKYIIEKANEKSAQEKIQIIRMTNTPSGLDREILDFNDIEEEIYTLDLDLRGY